jgi:FMN phosphatase YigB (HAD superfamily)
VDDLQENIDTANWLGMHGIVFENSAQAMADVESKLA